MGTRGTFGFRAEGKDKVSYNHWDSYPSGLGVTVGEFIKSCEIAELGKMSKNILMIDADSKGSKPSAKQKKAVRDFEKANKVTVSNVGVGGQSLDDWYCLLREAQGKLDFYKLGLEYMIDSQNFLKDSLFCEWAYIINTDSGNLEIYKGFNKNPNAKGRYASQCVDSDKKYYGVELVREIPLEEVRAVEKMDEFMGKIEKEIEAQEEKENA